MWPLFARSHPEQAGINAPIVRPTSSLPPPPLQTGAISWRAAAETMIEVQGETGVYLARETGAFIFPLHTPRTTCASASPGPREPECHH
jgi:hypothetical protein